MQAAAKLGISVTISQVGSDSPTGGTPASMSSVDRKEWQPAFALDEDGLLYQLRATLMQAIDAYMRKFVHHYFSLSILYLYGSVLWVGFIIWIVDKHLCFLILPHVAKLPLANLQQSPQQNPMIPIMQECVDAITEHQRLHTLMKGEWAKGLLPHTSVPEDYMVQRIQGIQNLKLVTLFLSSIFHLNLSLCNSSLVYLLVEFLQSLLKEPA